MAIALKLSTASQEIPIGRAVDSTDGDSEETALTINASDIKLWKNGATTLASKNSGGATHIANGIYYAILDATDTDTLGPLKIFVHVAGARPMELECVVYTANIYNSLIAGTDLFDVSVTQWTGTAVAAVDTAGYPKVTVKSGTGTGEVSLSSGLMRLSATGVDDILDEVVEGTRTFRQYLRGFGAALLSKVSGYATNAPVFRDVDDSKNRISATVDATGNRSAVTLDLT